MLTLWFLILASSKSWAQPQCGQERLLNPIIQSVSSNDSTLCESSKVGETRTFDWDASVSPTTVESHYQLTHVSGKKFLITFNPSFFSDESLSPADQAALNKTWRSKSEKCLNELNGNVRDSLGHMIEFGLIRTSDRSGQLPLDPIEIKSQRARGNSKFWQKDFDCRSIDHELLHHAGLVDEYAENSIVIGKSDGIAAPQYLEAGGTDQTAAFDCRTKHTDMTIMRDQEMAGARYRLDVGYCECRPGNAVECDAFNQSRLAKIVSLPPNQQIHEVKYPKSCPAGFQKSQFKSSTMLNDDSKKKMDRGGLVGAPNPKGLTFVQVMKMPMIFSTTKIDPPPLMTDRQINSILFPGCYSKNVDYYEEAANAYRTSLPRGGAGCADFSRYKNAKAVQ